MIPKKQNLNQLRFLIKRLVYLFAITFSIILLLFCFLLFNPTISSWFQEKVAELRGLYVDIEKNEITNRETAQFWKPVDISLITDETLKKEVEYGKDLIAHTAKYFGPNGSVKKITNGMNCNNCHLDAGTKPWGNNFGSVYSMYPKMSARSGKLENLYERINDCMERSLNGKSLGEDEKEMKAMIAYIEYIGKNVPKNKEAGASGIYKLKFLDRAANPITGKSLFAAKCASCHQLNGQGVLAADKKEYTYPPLWGDHSYNKGAGLYRISSFAGYIKYNMPNGVTFDTPQLSDEEAWDIAAYVETQPRPTVDFSADWLDISKKPIDYPFGPFSDKFTEEQHKFGPFKPIKLAHSK